MNNGKNIVILGAGGFAREVAWLIEEINGAGHALWNIIGFWERSKERVGQLINQIPVIDVEEINKYLPDLYAVAAIGDPVNRERAIGEAEKSGLTFPTLIHPEVKYDPNTVSFGPGTIICAGNIITTNINIGAHVIINLDCTIGHDCDIEDFVTISPGCHLSGKTIIRKGAYLGTGATTVERHEIGAYSILGAGAVVVKDIPANVIAVGIPASIIKQKNE